MRKLWFQKKGLLDHHIRYKEDWRRLRWDLEFKDF